MLKHAASFNKKVHSCENRSEPWRGQGKTLNIRFLSTTYSWNPREEWCYAGFGVVTWMKPLASSFWIVSLYLAYFSAETNLVPPRHSLLPVMKATSSRSLVRFGLCVVDTRQLPFSSFAFARSAGEHCPRFLGRSSELFMGGESRGGISLESRLFLRKNRVAPWNRRHYKFLGVA